MSEAILEQQDIKNLEAAQTMEEQLDRATKEAEDAHTAYFALRRTAPHRYNMTQETILWNRYIKAHRAEQDYMWVKLAHSKRDYNIQPRDPNDYQEDDKVPADPQEQMMEYASK